MHFDYYNALLHVRPTQLGDLLKHVVGIRRTWVKTKTGHRFWIDPVSVLGSDLLRGGTYEEQMTKLVETLLRPSDVFVDIGANEGYFSVIAASKVPYGAVHSVEPQSRLQQILRTNIESNGSKVTFIHATALSSSEGYLDLFLRPSTNTGASSVFRHWKLGSRNERVACMTLDSLFRQQSILRARLIKIDCEGAEYLVISGANKVLSEQLVDFIAMEYHPSICGPAHCRDTHSKLTAAGYILTKIKGQCIYHLPSLEDNLRPVGELTLGASWANGETLHGQRSS